MRGRLVLALAAASAGRRRPAPPPRAAADEASIAYVERTDDGLQILVSVPPDATVDIDDVTVTVDGTATEADRGPRRLHHLGAAHRRPGHRHQQLDARRALRGRPDRRRHLPRHGPRRRLRRHRDLRQRRHRRRSPRAWTATRPAPSSRSSSSTQQTRLYDGVPARPRHGRQRRASASCWCSPTAPTPATPTLDDDHRRRSTESEILVNVVAPRADRSRRGRPASS